LPKRAASARTTAAIAFGSRRLGAEVSAGIAIAADYQNGGSAGKALVPLFECPGASYSDDCAKVIGRAAAAFLASCRSNSATAASWLRVVVLP
jgi:hypothetical protein